MDRNHCGRFEKASNRREFLAKSAFGFGALALGHLVMREAAASEPGVLATGQLGGAAPLAPKAAHFPATAQSVIFLFMTGGPSHLETFDPKPLLAKYAGKVLPGDYLPTERKTGAAMPSPFKFAPRGDRTACRRAL